MKLRVTGLLLASLMLVTVTVPAFAAAVADEADTVEQEVETQETNASTSPFYLNDEQLVSLEYELIGGINYVTVDSFLSAMYGETALEEADGLVLASSVTVTEVIDVIDVDAETEEEAQDDEVDPDAEPEDQAEPTQPAETTAANVVEETLTFTARTGDVYVVANGRYLYVPTGVLSVNDKVAVPIRTMARVFNLDVGYDRETRHVTLTKQEGSDAYLLSGEAYYDEDTLYWLSHIIYAESGNQSLKGKLAVGNVVMNRVNSPLFPSTIKAVLFQKNQFSPASSGSIYREPNAASVIAAKLVMDGAVVLENALFFNRAGMNTYASRNRTYVATIGAHAFYG